MPYHYSRRAHLAYSRFVVMSDSNSGRDGLASLGLQNRLLEVAVIVGMNNETGLRTRRGTEVRYRQLFLSAYIPCRAH